MDHEIENYCHGMIVVGMSDIVERLTSVDMIELTKTVDWLFET